MKRRRFSLRTRVAAAAALGATFIVIALGVVVALAIARNNLSQLDRRLETASTVIVANAATAGPFLGAFGDGGAFSVTIRSDTDGTVKSSTPTRLPELPVGSATVDVDGTKYRAYTAEADGINALVSLAVPYAEARDITVDQQRQVAFFGVGAVGAAAALGWLFGGPAVRPLVELTRRIARRDPDLATEISGIREADELAAAAESMLSDVARAQAATNSALAAARDFASASAHELRTPLTAMRTDIEVLSIHDLDHEQRREILTDLARAQGRVESTLRDLERLAKGELSTAEDFKDTDLTEVCDIAADDARRHHRGLDVSVATVDSPLPYCIRALPGGIRLILDNAITNAVRHGGASTVRITLARPSDSPDTVTITIDDNGCGIPAEERSSVFERFTRGSTAGKTGSGLGLALVAQQAALHGGRTTFHDSPLGGARLLVELRDQPGSE
ncbi:HAMP domain-containing sensor histidine kinase [Rhodococcus erythropolis]|uniref:sensor histidine kinase n=1 Tax=Rhodococcus erythropolis TaxID=1833 RepID=UPI002949568D|nr:HAMP domain-containing sensor histidine kinase [Rhodococcus erythropolis]MDV6276979.1 HAMP domain-containing sensor histidine kinase [Rhodococcus erythropolis]